MMEALFYFIFFYPLYMAFFWMIGSLLFFFRHEHGKQTLPTLAEFPHVAILVPCHNEAVAVRDTIERLRRNKYPDFEIIAINDGSTDDTGAILDEIAEHEPRLRAVHLGTNYGKAMALRAGVMASRAEFILCIDADTLLEEHAIHWMISHFLDGPRVGAVTGNPRIANRRTLLGRVQIGEFSAIVGMVKRSQRDLGRVFTISGCLACFRRRALHNIGYWSPETVTEDIDVSWKLQLGYWDVRYEPRALAWVAMPETFKGLWRQRLRWACGGFEAAIKHRALLKDWTKRRMWPVYVEYVVSAVWCYAWAFTVLCFFMTLLLPALWPGELAVETLLPRWAGVVLGVTCLLQFTVGLFLDSHYERGIIRHLFWAIWYPAIFWVLSAVATIVAIPKALRKRTRTQVRYATWKSPERGVR